MNQTSTYELTNGITAVVKVHPEDTVGMEVQSRSE